MLQQNGVVMGFTPFWILYIAGLYISIFLFLVILKTIFKESKLLKLCLACAVPIIGFFGFVFGFPPIIVAFLLGSAVSTLADLTNKWIEEKQKKFFMYHAIINISFAVIAIFVIYLMYGNN